MNINPDFLPKNEEERKFFELHDGLSKRMSTLIMSLPPEERLRALKKFDIVDIQLTALYIWAIKQEDYETCIVAKELMVERDMAVTTWPFT